MSESCLIADTGNRHDTRSTAVLGSASGTLDRVESGLTRRGLLGAAAAASAVAFTGTGRALGATRAGSFAATDLEVVTITPTSVEIFWLTHSPDRKDADNLPVGIDTDTELRLGPADATGPLPVVHHDQTRRSSHHVEVTGLEPGRTYRFEARSEGILAVPSMVLTRMPGSSERAAQFTTLPMPRGSYLRSIALLNDVHLGETKQGIIVGDILPYAQQKAGQRPYAEMMLAEALAEVGRRFAHPPVVVNGDVTNNATQVECQTALSVLNQYGGARRDWWVTRGNHDRALKNRSGGHDDWFGHYFGLPWQQMWSHSDGGLRIIGLDTTRYQLSGGVIDDSQFDALDQELRRDPDIPTVVAGHHPVTLDAAMTTASGPFFTLGPLSSKRLQEMEGAAPGIFFHQSGHTHRARLGHPDFGQRIEYLETGSAAAYPGGYTMLHLFTGGYLVNFHRTSSRPALDWLTRSRSATLGALAQVTLGSRSDRNHVVARDLSGVAPDGRPVPAMLRA